MNNFLDDVGNSATKIIMILINHLNLNLPTSYTTNQCKVFRHGTGCKVILESTRYKEKDWAQKKVFLGVTVEQTEAIWVSLCCMYQVTVIPKTKWLGF